MLRIRFTPPRLQDLEDLKTGFRDVQMSSQQSKKVRWLTHGKKWNFD
jgi:hypothetical protein